MLTHGLGHVCVRERWGEGKERERDRDRQRQRQTETETKTERQREGWKTERFLVFNAQSTAKVVPERNNNYVVKLHVKVSITI